MTILSAISSSSILPTRALHTTSLSHHQSLSNSFNRHGPVPTMSYITLQHQLINSIKRGSSKEASLTSCALGLLAITVGSGDNAHEILEESTPHLSQALKSGTDSLKRSSVCVTMSR